MSKVFDFTKWLWYWPNRVLPYRSTVSKIFLLLFFGLALYSGAQYWASWLVGLPNRSTKYIGFTGVNNLPVLPFTSIHVVWYLIINILAVAAILWGLLNAEDDTGKIRPNGIFAFISGFLILCIMWIIGQIS